MSVKDVLKPIDDGFAGKIASNKEIKENVSRILKLMEERDNISSDIKSVYVAAHWNEREAVEA